MAEEARDEDRRLLTVAGVASQERDPLAAAEDTHAVTSAAGDPGRSKSGAVCVDHHEPFRRDREEDEAAAVREPVGRDHDAAALGELHARAYS